MSADLPPRGVASDGVVGGQAGDGSTSPGETRLVRGTRSALRPPSDARQRWLRVCHDTVYEYDAPVELAHHLAWLRPRETAQQRIHGWSLEITPHPDAASTAGADLLPPDAAPASALPGDDWSDGLRGVHQSQDVWGNWRAGFSHARVHDRLEVRSSFVAELSAPPVLQPPASAPWEAVADQLRYHPGRPHDAAVEFALPSYFAPRDAALARFAREVFRPGTPLLVGALRLMQRVHREFAYRPAATTVTTRATDALAQRHGVCQDFAHVMIGALRSIGLAARYVSGYLLTHPPPGQPRLVGADASHAWMAVWCPLHGWVALDPTNDVPAGLDHVTLAWGRDYADVAPLRGVIRGGGRAQPRVGVTVEPVS